MATYHISVGVSTVHVQAMAGVVESWMEVTLALDECAVLDLLETCLVQGLPLAEVRRLCANARQRAKRQAPRGRS